MWLCLPDCSHISSNLIYHCCQEGKPMEPVICCFLSNSFSRGYTLQFSAIGGTLLAYYYEEQCSLSLNLPIDPGNLHRGGGGGGAWRVPIRSEAPQAGWCNGSQAWKRVWVEVVGCDRLEWDDPCLLQCLCQLHRLALDQWASNVLLGFWSTTGYFFPCQVVNCTLLWLWV